MYDYFSVINTSNVDMRGVCQRCKIKRRWVVGKIHWITCILTGFFRKNERSEETDILATLPFLSIIVLVKGKLSLFCDCVAWRVIFERSVDVSAEYHL
jgi:hypothetical protein